MTVRRNRYSFLSVWIVILTLAASSTVQAHLPLALNGNERPTLAPLLDEVTPAVVNISVKSTAEMRQRVPFQNPNLWREFQRPRQNPAVPGQGAGSGVIVDASEGYVLTNHHVIERAGVITVVLQDRRQFKAELIGSDKGTDIALLKIPAEDLTALELGDSRTLKVGDFVVAIGNPFGLGQTVTSGIVSALGRSGINLEGYEDFIQTDASINPGNSGGALIDLDGRLVGINTAIIAPAGGNVGIGFAVPAHMAEAVIEQLLEYGEVRRGRLGINIQDVTPELAEALELDSADGAVVTQVENGSSAETAGLVAGDVILAIDGKPVTGSAALRNLVGLARVDDEVEITVFRDGEQRSVNALIGERSAAGQTERRVLSKLLGARFQDVGRAHPYYGEGVFVANVEQGSPAWRNGLRSTDLILAVNRHRVSTTRELRQALAEAGSTVALDVIRADARILLVIQ